MSRSSNDHLDPHAFEHIVVFFANALGDHLMALPTLRALSAACGGRLTLATAMNGTDLLFGDVRCNRIAQVPIRWADGELDPIAVSQVLGPTDLFISVNYWHNPSLSALIDQMSPTVTVGFNPKFGWPLVLDGSRHHVDQVFQVCEALGLTDKPEAHAYPFPLPAESVHFAERLRAALDGMKLLVVHLHSKPAKTWPIDQANRAIEAFVAAHPDYAAIALAKQPEQLTGLSPCVIPLTGLPLASASAVVAAADIFLGVDSFPLHVADLWKRPGVGLYGPTESSHWGYRFTPSARHIDSHGAMADIDPEHVAAVLSEVSCEAADDWRSNLVGAATAPVVTLRYL